MLKSLLHVTADLQASGHLGSVTDPQQCRPLATTPHALLLTARRAFGRTISRNRVR